MPTKFYSNGRIQLERFLYKEPNLGVVEISDLNSALKQCYSVVAEQSGTSLLRTRCCGRKSCRNGVVSWRYSTATPWCSLLFSLSGDRSAPSMSQVSSLCLLRDILRPLQPYLSAKLLSMKGWGDGTNSEAVFYGLVFFFCVEDQVTKMG